MKSISIDALNNHLFEAIEMLKNNKDPEASPNEKVDVETAKTIADIGKVVIDGFKVKAQVLNMLRGCENPRVMAKMVVDSGIVNDSQLSLVAGKVFIGEKPEETQHV